MAKWVYKFEEGSAAMRNLLGGKGCNLAEMTNLGMPIPQGFTVTTEACTDYYNSGKQITKEIQDGDFFKNEALLAAMKNAKDNDSAIHFMGLLSDGGVHSHNTHLYGLLEMAKREGLKKVYVHCFLDGRDTPPESGKGFVEQLEAKMKEIGVGDGGCHE